jgi:hypothetical protein
VVTIQAAMGHSVLATTGRYWQARPASGQAAVFTRAFDPSLARPGSASATGTLQPVSIGLRRLGASQVVRDAGLEPATFSLEDLVRYDACECRSFG